MGRLGLRGRIVLPVVAILVAGFCGYGAWELSALEETYRREALEKRARALTVSLGIPLRKALLDRDLLALDRTLTSMERGRGFEIDLVDVRVTDREGRILASHPPGRTGEVGPFPAPHRRSGDARLAYVERDGREVLEVLRPLGFGDQHWGYFLAGFSTARLREALAATRLRLAIAVGLVILLTVACVHAVLSRNLFGPVDRLTEEATRIREGDFDLDLPTGRSDEIGLLFEAFEEMADGLAQREVLREAFGQYVGTDVAEAILAGRIPLEGEKRRVTALICDLRSFTARTHREAPGALIDDLTRFLDGTVRCVVAEGGMVDKFLGDGLLAIFGAPVDLDDAPGAAVRATRRILEQLDELNADLAEEGRPPLEAGVGMATGDAICGVVETRHKKEYTALGDPVNLASRLESLTKELGTSVALDDETARDLPEGELEDLGEHPVRGVDRPVGVHGLARAD